MAEYVVLDTDVASHAQRQQLPEDYARQLDASVPCITFVTVAEFYKGAFKRNWGPARIQRYEAWMQNLVVLPYDAGVAREWGRITVGCDRAGRSIAANDAWIAACCRRHDLPLMTLNRRHFEAVQDLVLVPSATT